MKTVVSAQTTMCTDPVSKDGVCKFEVLVWLTEKEIYDTKKSSYSLLELLANEIEAAADEAVRAVIGLRDEVPK